MATYAIRPRLIPKEICQICEPALLRHPRNPRVLLSLARRKPFLTPIISRQRHSDLRSQFSQTSKVSETEDVIKTTGPVEDIEENDAPQREYTQDQLERAQEQARTILSNESIPSEDVVVAAIKSCSGQSERPPTADGKRTKSTTSTLLSLDSRSPKPQPSDDIATNLSDLAYQIITYPPVFITPEVLSAYIDTQSSLCRPSTLPEVFYLYANKPVPQANSSPIQYSSPNPDRISQAVPPATARAALDAAIISKELPLALDIINTTYRTNAYRKAKVFRQASIPIAGALATPLAIWAVANQVTDLQDMVDNPVFRASAVAGMATYVGATSLLLYISITTANDQMERVVWKPGMGLAERWIREDERSALDRLAIAWGFKDRGMRGLEDSEEWEALRIWVAERGMILDKTELMEGME